MYEIKSCELILNITTYSAHKIYKAI